ncbi:hypothetical protein DVH24_005377 [Malus domestica]|uniref:O-methyltransferase dimerisation domain-containing protein n=1 Tax=Malus domestica TaxID=3750 RepID=A0A498KMG0_MALDO|nr:hypothetical protein DVH24_005377 [Malus domestica]
MSPLQQHRYCHHLATCSIRQVLLADVGQRNSNSTRNSEAPMMLDRILRLLASHSTLSCSVVANEEDGSDSQRLYSLGPVSNYFVTNEDGVSLGPMMALMQDKVVLDSWSV